MDAFVSGSWRTTQRAEIFIGGAWRPINRGEVYLGGWKACLSFRIPLTLSVSPTYVSGSSSPNKPIRQTVTTTTAVATPTGGVAPYSYSWSAPDVTPTKPTLAYTEFTKSLASGEEVSGSAQVVCTDAVGTTAIGGVEYYLYNDAGSFS